MNNQDGTSSEGEDDDDDIPDNEQLYDKAPTKFFRHLIDADWRTFVETKLRKFETKWTKKLEDYTEEDH